MNLVKLALCLALLVEAADVSEKYDQSLIASDYGERSQLFDKGLSDRNDQEVHLLIKTDSFINHIRNLALHQEPLEFRDPIQYDSFIKDFRKYLVELKMRHAELKAKRDHIQAEAEKTWSIFSSGKKAELLHSQAEMDAKLIAMEKEILKMMSFDDFCYQKGCSKFTTHENSHGLASSLKDAFHNLNNLNPFSHRGNQVHQ